MVGLGLVMLMHLGRGCRRAGKRREEKEERERKKKREGREEGARREDGARKEGLRPKVLQAGKEGSCSVQEGYYSIVLTPGACPSTLSSCSTSLPPSLSSPTSSPPPFSSFTPSIYSTPIEQTNLDPGI